MSLPGVGAQFVQRGGAEYPLALAGGYSRLIPSHFPIQNVEKILLRMSSAVVAPVIASIGLSAA